MPTAGNIYYFAAKKASPTALPVILVHGAGGDHLHWPHNIRRMNGFRIIAPDLPGHGKSEGLGAQKVSEYAKTLIDLLLDLGISRAVFIGHSMGGAIVQTLALDHSEHVLGIGLVGTGGRLPVNSELLDKLCAEATFPKAVQSIVKWSYSREVDEKMSEYLQTQLMENRPSVMHGDYSACDQFNVLDRLAEIKVPTQIIVGEDDVMTPLRLSQNLAESIPGAKLAVISNAGHMVMQEQPEAVADVLHEFLKGIEY